MSQNRANSSEDLKNTFNQVSETYDKMRPTYVGELYQDIFNYKEINQKSNVLEIGIGSGQATPPILETGCSLTAIELGDKLAAFAMQKFKNYENFNVHNLAFEDFKAEDNSFDMIYSASAFHWIPEEIGYTKVYKMLKSGGIFARFANHPSRDKEKQELHVAMQKLYSIYMPKAKPAKEYTEEDAKNRAEMSKKYGFVDVTYKLYNRTRTFTSEEYIALLGTYSDHIALEESKRKEFFNKIKREIDNFGGTITMYDTIDLQLSKKL